MKSLTLGKSTSAVEVVSISKHGFWLHVHGDEHFLSFKLFPWFKDAKVASVLKVKLLHHEHLYWPDLDVDLELESLKHPEKHPLTYRQLPNPRLEPTRG